MRDSLNRIYQSTNVQWEVSLADAFDIPQLAAGINDADDKILSAYSNDMSTVIDQFQNPMKDVYYMFVAPHVDSINSKEGYMCRLAKSTDSCFQQIKRQLQNLPTPLPSSLDMEYLACGIPLAIQPDTHLRKAQQII